MYCPPIVAIQLDLCQECPDSIRCTDKNEQNQWLTFVKQWRGKKAAEHARRLIERACLAEGVHRPGLVLHSDNGSPMKGATMLSTLQRLGVVPSFSRPSVSVDKHSTPDREVRARCLVLGASDLALSAQQSGLRAWRFARSSRYYALGPWDEGHRPRCCRRFAAQYHLDRAGGGTA